MIRLHCRPWEYCITISHDKRLAVVAPETPSCDYVRLVYDGHELAVWNIDDWVENMEGSMGVILGVIALINIGEADRVMAWIRGEVSLDKVFDDDRGY